MLLTSRKLNGVMSKTVTQPDPFEPLGRPFPGVGSELQFERDHHVLQSAQRRNQLEILKDESDVRAAEAGAVILTHPLDTNAVDRHRTGRRIIQPGTKSKKRRLAAARGADDCAGRPSGNGKGDFIQNSEGLPAAHVGLCQLLY